MLVNTVPPNDFTYWEMVNGLVQQEAAEAGEPEMLGLLAAVGIVKGQPFKPSPGAATGPFAVISGGGSPTARPARRRSRKVYDNLDLMHAVEAFLNAYQGASTSAIRNGPISAGVPDNTVLIFSTLMDARSLFLTVNGHALLLVRLDMTQGPVVVETPPMSLGVIDDMWFGWVTDFGLPGPDRGAGGKYLLLPPGYTGELPDSGYIVARVRTTRAIMILGDGSPLALAMALNSTIDVHPVSSALFLKPHHSSKPWSVGSRPSVSPRCYLPHSDVA